jgi:hypothetical protein
MRSKHVFLALAGLLSILGCANVLAEKEGDDPGECEDGADNDGNGAFDCDDAACLGAPTCRPPPAEAQVAPAAVVQAQSAAVDPATRDSTVAAPAPVPSASKCPWSGSLIVTALWDHVTINGRDYRVDTQAERVVFAGQLHDCNADAATGAFLKWQQLRDQAASPVYAVRATVARDKFVGLLEGTTPPKR